LMPFWAMTFPAVSGVCVRRDFEEVFEAAGAKC